MLKKIFVLTKIVCMLFVSSACQMSNKKLENEVVKTDTGSYELKSEEIRQTIVPRNVESVYKDIHYMANTVVIAKDKWGKEQIKEENLNTLITEVSASDYTDKKILLDILNRWKDGDFSKADEDHNYVWDQLGGTVGKATGIDWDNIPLWAEKNKDATD